MVSKTVKTPRSSLEIHQNSVIWHVISYHICSGFVLQSQQSDRWNQVKDIQKQLSVTFSKLEERPTKLQEVRSAENSVGHCTIVLAWCMANHVRHFVTVALGLRWTNCGLTEVLFFDSLTRFFSTI